MNQNQRIRRSRVGVKLLGLLAAVMITQAVVPAALADDTLAYRRQFQALDPSDVAGHMNLAKWCREQEAWELLEKQCDYLLRLEPDHAMAKVYRELARSKNNSTPDDNSSASGPNTTSGPGNRKPSTPIRELTNEEIQILRRSELALNRPERVPVNFKNRVLDRFWNYLSMRENLGPRDRATFNRLRPATRKAQFILGKIQSYERASLEDSPFVDEFSKDIEIEDDPAMFRAFKSPRVSGVILSSCATARCHGGRDAGDFMLFNERVMNDRLHYANYMALNEYEKDGERLINRDNPQRSLLLIFGQPQTTGPGSDHPTEVDVVFPNARNTKYRNLLSWIASLDVIQPDYGFSLDEPAKTSKGSKP
ncbi:MAG: hypothetical protein DHS20C16_31570 [Phycisphaerae bacterium]|nr:MAG: hypothetical protein DHS20C16_31570 [Phycisphaerae bacterium]